MNNITEGVFTSGSSFRANVEARARAYRVTSLLLKDFDTYGHILTEEDAKIGYNFLPSMRKEILSAVRKRNDQGKGVDMNRTTKNMLSSQAMCFNLFVPLNLNKKFATTFFKQLLGDCQAIIGDIEIEYTPSTSIFHDQSGKGGVDCDALLQYENNAGQHSILIMETKYVETEFSICGFRKNVMNKQNKKRDLCPPDTIVNQGFSNCRYHYKKHYKYWEVAEESELFKMELIHDNLCPFGGALWQLWVNMTLAYAVAKEKGCDDFGYAVICHERNSKLSDNGKVFTDFKRLLKNPNKFKVIYLSDIKKSFESTEGGFSDIGWTMEFAERYCFEI